ncbi:MAG: hypothetical protein IT380_25110 [Myxococcales bacterium]|nr:hypothetical protein [Myxococcales bacterium]
MAKTDFRALALAHQPPRFEAWLLTTAPRAEWAHLNLEDLGLAWLAVQGEPQAVAELERRLRLVTSARLRASADSRDEVLQRARGRLLVGERPKLLAFRGRGSLMQYLKAVVSSVAVDLARATPKTHDGPASGRLLAIASNELGADARLASASLSRHFTRALTHALLTLAPEERLWLRMRFVDGLSVEAVGAAFGVHRTTALRRLEKAQARLLTEVRALLRDVLRLGPKDLDSLLRTLRPSLTENLSRLLPRVREEEP